MPNIEGQKKWSPIRLLETHELARGGINGNLNEQAKALADRTEFLNQEKANKSEIVQGVFEFGTYAEFNAAKSTLPLSCTVVIGEENTTGTGLWAIGNNSWNGTILKKSAYDPLTASIAYTDVLNLGIHEELINLDQTDKFFESVTKGVFLRDFATLANATLDFRNGSAVITSNLSSGVMQSLYTGRKVIDGYKREINLKFKVEDVSSTNGCAIFIGENFGILYASNGTIQLVTPDWTVVSQLADANLGYVANELVDLKILLNTDGSGVATAIKSSGYNRSFAFSGMQKGKIYLAVRRSFAGKSTTFESLSVKKTLVELDAVSDVLKKSQPLGFGVSEVDGFYSAETDEKYGLYRFSNSNRVLNLDTNGGNSAVYYSKIDMSFNSSSEFEAEFKRKTGSNTSGCCVVFGDGANRKIFAYLTNGAIGLLTSAGGIADGAVHSDMSFGNDETAKIRILVSDGQAILTAIHPSGKQHIYKSSGVDYGNVYLAWRGNNVTADINYFNKRNIPASFLNIENRLTEALPTSKYPKTWKVLPDSVPGRSVKGFTCTGLAKITAGQFRGCWAVGDDGRLSEDISSPYVPQIHILDGDFNSILQTIAGGYTNNSMQGVTFDTVTNSHIWAACAGNNTIRKYSLGIGSEGEEIVDDRITMASLGLSITPNALAFDATRGTGKGALWLGANAGGTIYLIDCDPAATTRVISTITVANTVDHIQLLDNQILYQGTSNGRKTTVYKYELGTNVESTVWVDLECWTAPEGFYYDKKWRTLFAVNDGGFHNSVNSSPRFNCAFEFILDM